MDKLKRFRNRSLHDRFHAKYDVIENGCWIWTDTLDKEGRGFLRVNNRRFLASRVSYKLNKGEIKSGLFVCHSCDNPSCVNPSHLWLGTNQDNLDDMKRKNRSCAGTKAHKHKLCEAHVRIIREARAANFKLGEIASYYKMNVSVISKLVNRKTWRNIL